MAKEKIVIEIDGKSTGAVSAAKQTESAISKLGKVIGGLAIGGGALMLAKKGFDTLENVMRKTIAAIKDCAQQAGYEETQIIKLNTSLKSTGNYTEEASAELQKYAVELQKTTIFADDATLAVEAMLATFKLNTDEIKVATQATLDLAAATGQDLQSAAILMGKAMVGETGMLKRYGIIVDENKYAAEGWRAVIDEINVEFGGQAQAQAEGYLGKLEQLKNVTGDLKEVMGNAFLPTFKTLIDRFINGTDIVDKFGNVIGKTKPPLETLRRYAEDLAKKISSFLKTLIDTDYSSVVKGLEMIGSALASLITGDSSFEMTDEKAQKFADTLGRIGREIASFITAIDLTKDAIVILGTVIDDLVIGPLEVWKNFNITFNAALRGDKDTILENRKAFMDWGPEIDDLDKKIKNFIDTIKNFGKDIDDSAQSADHAALSTRNVRIEIWELREASKELKMKEATESIEGLGEAADDADKEIESLVKTLWKLYNINQSITEATWDFEDAVKEAEEIIKNKTSTDREQEQAIFDVQDALEDLQTKYEEARESGKLTIGMQGDIQKSFIESGLKAMEMGLMTRFEFESMAQSLGINQKFLSGSLAIFNKDLDVSGGKVLGLKEYIASLPSKKDINIYSYMHTVNLPPEWVGTGQPRAGIRQSGGIARLPEYISDLRIPIFKGEAVLPAEVVRAIKENRSSFAGVGAAGGGIINNFNISQLVVREEADVERIATELHYMQLREQRGGGYR